MRLTSKELCERIKTDIAIKTTTKEQAQQLVAWLKEGGLGFNWYVIWDDVKRGSIFKAEHSKLIYDRDAAKFTDRKIVLFKNLKIVEE